MLDFIVEIVFQVVIYSVFNFVSNFIAQRLGLGRPMSGCLSFLMFALLVGLCVGAVSLVLSSSATATPIPR